MGLKKCVECGEKIYDEESTVEEEECAVSNVCRACRETINTPFLGVDIYIARPIGALLRIGYKLLEYNE